ncbi:DEAD/DEAH box helicase [Promicromonospora vindobonensis]|uniref:DEAD/DEAH box helicase n=1 Tax=Promicromonospora vindobonensis TaxID=195748 RepID=A0ABW5VPM6_9MICO
MRERQRITIANYTNDPDLLEEHVGMEDNFQAGGYGERQVEELLQNAIDRLVEPGRAEFRLANGTLYCANEGEPFAAAGVRAVAGAFLSPKRDEQIGRFGLGFKSVLGVTDHPQILSRTVSFGFNEPEAAELLSDLPYRPTRVPTLRVPSIIDARACAAEDPNVAEMMGWAATIVRLPLVRGGARLRERLKGFDFRYLLFPDRLNQVVISLGERGEVVSRSYRKTVDVDSGLVTLKSPDADDGVWRVLHREHHVSEGVKANLPGLFHRDRVRVSYALPVGQGRREDGEFWAWFPLQDKTTAQGIFNAPWQVNDDRTSLLPVSELNGEMLNVAAELLIDAALLESTPADPAKHFDVLPARGREVRSAADAYMSGRVPQLARRHQLIPTASGEMRSPAKVRAPFITNASGDRSFALPSETIRLWSEATGAIDTPHWSCYQTPTRAARLTQLLSDEKEKISATPIAPAAWLAEAAAPRTLETLDAALTIFLKLKEQQEQVWRQFTGALVVPLENGSIARISDFDKILLPVEGVPSPGNVQLVASAFAAAPEVRSKLRRLGVHEVSRDQVAIAAAASANSTWREGDWKHFWELVSQASPDAGRTAIEGIQQLKIEIQVPTKAGTWRPASQVFLDARQVPGLPERQVDIPGVKGRSDLVGYAGCLSGVAENWPVHQGEVFEEYRAAMQAQLEKKLASQYGQNVRAKLRFDARKGSGPLEILKELAQVDTSEADIARARLTVLISEGMPQQRISVLVDIRGVQHPKKAEFDAVETWCVRKYGLLDSTWGVRRSKDVLAKALVEYGDLLPVVRDSLAGHFALPSRLDEIPTVVLREFLGRNGYIIGNAALLADVLSEAAARPELVGVAAIPALGIGGRTVQVTPIDQVVIAAADELDDLASHGLRYIPSGPWGEALSNAWNLQTAADVVARSIDWDAAGDAVPVLDVYPTLDRVLPSGSGVENAMLRRCSSIVRRTTSLTGSREQRLSGHVDGYTVLVDAELSDVEALVEVSRLLRLGLTRADAEDVIASDERLRKNALVQTVQAAPTESAKLLKLVERAGLVANLPDGLLDIIEEKQGKQSDAAVADIFLSTYGNDSLRRLKSAIAARHLAVPRVWDGSSEADGFVTNLGFPRAFAGTREKKAPAVDIVPGRVDLKALHDFQEHLLDQIRELVLIREKDGEHRRGLLYLPTGAGKTRVTTESIARMLRDNELASPVLWIAQSEELCEQAIVSWAEVWRAIGDQRPLEITRYWGAYEADESLQELQIVVATDAKLAQMIDSKVNNQAHRWLQDAKLVVIDEAHRAGSQRYTKILDWLGIDQRRGSRTARPLLGLTATPYRGTNLETNRLFAQRFGDRRLDALDRENPTEQLREMRVLSNVEHQLLDSKVTISEGPTMGKTGAVAWDDVSRAILDKLGSNLDRTQLLVNHILRQEPEWPILVFTPSVVSAHVTAALLRTLDRTAEAVDGEMRGQERRRKIESFRSGETKVLVNCDLLTQGFDAPKVRALYIARPTFSPNRYVQMVGRGLRGPLNGGTEKCLIVNIVDTFEQFDKDLAYTEFDYLWTQKGARIK